MCVVVCVCFLHRQGSPSRCMQSLIVQQVKCVNRNALSMIKALNKGFKQKCAVLILNQVEGQKSTLIFFLIDSNSIFVFEGIQSCAKNVISH